jgi:transcriptional regulator with XRE-family HTH domain
MRAKRRNKMSKPSLRAILGANLRRLRKARGLTQEALADEAGINKNTPSAIERGRYAATVDVIEKLARALEVDEIELLKRNHHKG